MIIDKINNDYLNKFDLQRALKSYDSPVFSSKESFENHQFIEKPYAFSSDNFFQRSKFSRKTNSINFKTREDLKIGQINTIGFNLVYDSKLRRNLPYYILYELPPSYYGSNICGQGNIYYSINQSNENIIKNLKFNELKNDCIKLDSKNSFFIF